MSNLITRRGLLAGGTGLILSPKTALADWNNPWNDITVADLESFDDDISTEISTDNYSVGLDLEIPDSFKLGSEESGLTSTKRPVARSNLASPPVVHNDSHHVAEGNIRRLKMKNRSDDSLLDIIYWRDGEFQAGPIKIITHYMRDWRNNKQKPIDRRTIDILGMVHAKLETEEPYFLVSGYRSPETNEMLIRRSRELNGGKSQVAKNSLHLSGQAADVRLAGFAPSQIAKEAKSARRGGVGEYPEFCHIDCGRPRSWKGA